MSTNKDQDARAHVIGMLADAIDRLTQPDCGAMGAIPGLTMHRRRTASEPMPCIYGFGLGLVVQGAKRAILDSEVYDYRPGDAMLTTVDVPVVANVTVASTASPFFGLMLAIDPRMVLDLTMQMTPRRGCTQDSTRSLAFGALDTDLLETVARLVLLLDQPQLAPMLAPLVQREIVVRLLHGQFGTVLRQAATAGSPNQQVARAVTLLKQNFACQWRIDALAAEVHMSPSTFRQHFRKLTGMSPLQYQKQLRLQEARQLMLTQHMDAGSAGARVGYDSASQFSREYARLFGMPPARDIQQARRDPSGRFYADAPPSINRSTPAM
jgi:AraC-like DNA-binding protein